jgi:Na+-translocating ferredoxin:NAD+ oxidoreductase subunit C
MNAPLTRKFWPLPRSIHPPENKHQSLREPIRRNALPQQLVIPLTQPGYAKPELCVQEGAHVLKGQLLARGTPQSGLNCHASTSGTVTAIGEHAVPNASGLPELCVLLSPDGLDEWQKLPAISDYSTATADTLIQRISDAGINGLGGAGFPTHTKLRGALGKVDTLIINACECEPFITADDALLREHAGEVVTGIKILLQLCKVASCLIGIEDNKPEAIAALQAVIDDARIQLVVVPTRYPSGAEKQLVYILTGKEIPSGSITLHNGILCHNVGTARAITRAVVHGEALVSRVVTLTGAALKRPGNLEVLIGTPIAALLQACDVDARQLSRLINGGPLMGLHLPHADLPVLKITNCIIATTREEMPPPAPQQACIRCGYCAEVCPVSLLPQQLYWFARSKELEKAEKHNLMDCIECGACAYVCPSHIPLVQYYRATKAEIRDEREKHRMAELSKERYDFHQARKAEEKALEEQRRAERAALARQKRDKAVDTGSTQGINVSENSASDHSASDHSAAGHNAASNDTSDNSAAGDSSAQATIAAALARVQAKKAERQAKAAATPAAVAVTPPTVAADPAVTAVDASLGAFDPAAAAPAVPSDTGNTAAKQDQEQDS